MTNYSTTTLTLTVPQDIEITQSEAVYVTIKQGNCELIHKLVDSVEGRTVTVTLDQNETAKFEEGQASLMLNIVYANGVRIPTREKTVRIYENLHKAVI